MLNNASGFRKVYIAAGYTDLRRGIDGLASIVKFNFQLEPYEKDILPCFAEDAVTASRGSYGKETDSFSFTKRAGAWQFQLAPYKRRSTEITLEQYQALMQGLEIVSRHPIQEVQPSDLL